MKKLTENDSISLLNTDISQHKKGYLSLKKLERKYKCPKLIDFSKKKYE